MDWSYNYHYYNATMRESDYPYISGYYDTHFTCANDASKGVAFVPLYYSVNPYSDDNLTYAISWNPVATGVSASSYFMQYRSGIIRSSRCGTGVNHAITAVGWGVRKGKKYFIFKNSWGSGWGENGYVRIGAGGGSAGYCGIKQYMWFPTVKAA